jgi:D-sedoheptulose 7-phosphate isomerase
MSQVSFAEAFLSEVADLARAISREAIELLALELSRIQSSRGRLFVLGVGGSAANASHAVADFRRLTKLDALTPMDNIAELTARTNDDGWEHSLSGWLCRSSLGHKDALLVFSVGGGSRRAAVSVNLVEAAEIATRRGAKVFVVAGQADGDVVGLADVAVVVPAPAERVTPLAESFQAVLWHLLVSHPLLAAAQPYWEQKTSRTTESQSIDG